MVEGSERGGRERDGRVEGERGVGGRMEGEERGEERE